MKLLNYFYLYNINKLILFNSLCLFQLRQDRRKKAQEIALTNVKNTQESSSKSRMENLKMGLDLTKSKSHLKLVLLETR